MGPKPFLLLEGRGTSASINITFNGINFNLPQLEKAPVVYSADSFTIGGHVFRYADIQSLSLENLGTKNPYCIQLKRRDDAEFVLFPHPGGAGGATLIKRTEELFRLLHDPWQKINQEETKKEQVRAKVQLEQGAVEKIRKMLTVSTRIKMDMMQRALSLDADTFSNKIFDWAADFGFKIDGDFVIIEGGDVTGFISKLDAEFADWGKKTGGKV
jgi:hypothetical protein